MSVETAVRELEQRFDLGRQLARLEGRRYRAGVERMTAVHLEDFTGIPFLDGIAGVEFYQHRARLRAVDGDTLVASTPSSPGYEEYCRGVLGLGRADVLQVQPGEDRLAIGRACTMGRARAQLSDLASRRGGLLIEPFIGVEVIWEIAEAVAADSGEQVRVLAPPPAVTWIANDKANFEDLVTLVHGPGYLPESRRSAHAGDLSRGLLELAEANRFVALKRLRCASAMGNEVFRSEKLRRAGRSGVRSIVEGFLERTGWDGREEVLAVVWEEAVSSPSTQWWVPPRGSGLPRLDGIYEQILAGEEGVFVGSRPSRLPAEVERTLRSHSGQVVLALQHLGYVGRCSFDHLLLGTGQVKFTECNGRWGGTSTPMNLVDRLYPEGRPPYQAQAFVHPDLAGMEFPELLARLGEAVLDRGLGAGRFLLYNVGPLPGWGKFDVIAIGSSPEHVEALVTEELPERLGLR